MNIIEQPFSEFNRARTVARNEAPHLYETLDRFRQTLGIRKPVTLILADSPTPNALAELENHRIFLTKGIFDITGTPSIAHAPSEGLKGLIAHEMSHMRDGKTFLIASRRLPVLAMPLLAVGGLHLCYNAMEKSKENPEKGLKEAVTEEAERCAEAHHHSALGADEARTLVKYAGYLAAAGLGLAGGLAATRSLNMAAEYRADRIAAKLCGNPEAYIQSLERVYAGIEKAAAREVRLRMEAVHTSSSFQQAGEKLLNRLKAYWQQEKMFHMLEVEHAHPALPARKAHIREFTGHAARATEQTVSPAGRL